MPSEEDKKLVDLVMEYYDAYRGPIGARVEEEERYENHYHGKFNESFYDGQAKIFDNETMKICDTITDRTYDTLWGSAPIKFKIAGRSSQIDKRQAEKITGLLDYQLGRADWDKKLDKICHILPVRGTVWVRYYWDMSMKSYLEYKKVSKEVEDYSNNQIEISIWP